MKYLGLDIGEAKIGVAVSDETGKFAFELTTIKTKGKSREKIFEEIDKIVDENGVEKIIVGLPKTKEGKLGKQAKKVIDFVEELKKYLQTEIIYEDERFTTAEAIKTLKEQGLKEKDFRHILDQIAAKYILQGYLDKLEQNIEDEL